MYSNENEKRAIGFGPMDRWILKISQQIKTYGKTINEEDAKMYQRWILNASNTYIFGFGFHRQNFDLLFEVPDKSGIGNAIDGTYYGVHSERMDLVRQRFCKYFKTYEPFTRSSDERNIKIEDFFRKSSVKIPWES